MRLLGAVLLASASYLFGVHLARREAEKLQAVNSLISFFTFMRRRMLSVRAPLYTVFLSYNDELLEKVGFLPELRARRYGLSGSFKRAIDTLRVDDELSNELALFGNDLGALPLHEQIKRIDGCLSVLEEKKKLLSESIPSKQKSVKTVCLLAGVLVAIIML